MRLNELQQLITKEAGDDPGVPLVFLDKNSGKVFSIQEVVYEFDPESSGTTCFLRGEFE